MPAYGSGTTKTKSKKTKWTSPWAKSEIKPYDKVWLKGKQVTWTEVQKLIDKYKNDPKSVRKIQKSISMPYEPEKGSIQPQQQYSGKWDEQTDFYYKEWLLNQSKETDKKLKESAASAKTAQSNISYIPNPADPNNPIATTAEDAERQNAIKSAQAERNRIQEDMMSTWKTLTGVTATEANINWATDRSLQGWGYDDFFFWMKDRPEMKELYPNMPKGMLPSEYNQVRDMLNSKYMEIAGRPLTHNEIGNVMAGGDFPQDKTFFGQPAIKDVGP